MLNVEYPLSCGYRCHQKSCGLLQKTPGSQNRSLCHWGQQAHHQIGKGVLSKTQLIHAIICFLLSFNWQLIYLENCHFSWRHLTGATQILPKSEVCPHLFITHLTLPPACDYDLYTWNWILMTILFCSHWEVSGFMGEWLRCPILSRLWKQVQHPEQAAPLSSLWVHHV